jgi:DNA modification methylase
MAKCYFKNEDCFTTLNNMAKANYKVDIVLTSPPYNTSRTSKTQKSFDTYNNRYDIHLDNMTDEQYGDWTGRLFNEFDKVLNKDGVVLYNISYGSENPNSMWLALANVLKNTNFMIAENITWKKKSALPNNVSHNKLTRITEFVFVICRKDEYKTYKANKDISKIGANGQKYYTPIYNFIEAANNDGSNPLNKATYSSELCVKLLNIYALENCIVYDPFMGTGTTAIACEKHKYSQTMTCIGSELSQSQVEYSKKRLQEFREKKLTQNLFGEEEMNKAKDPITLSAFTI